MTSSTDTDKKLDQLIQSINTLAYIIERRGRSDTTTSHYDDTFYYRGTSQNKENEFLRNLGGFNNTDFVNLMNEAMKDLEKDLKNTQDSIKYYKEQLKDTTLTTEQRKNLNDELNKAIDKEIELQKAQNNTLKEEFKRRQKIEEEKLRKEYQSFVDEKKALYGNEDNYVNYKKRQADFAGATANRNEASRMIAESGFGNTAVGRYAQTIVGRQQRIDNIANFGDNLQMGGAEQIAQAFGGGGKAAAFAAKALGGFGKGLGIVSKFLGGPFVQAILLAIDGLKKIGEVMNDWKDATADMYKHQTKQEQLQYELSKQQMVIENQMKIENISAQGDTQMKMLETQGATMLEALKITSAQYAKSVEVAIGPLTKGINETAYDAANAQIDAALQIEKLGLHQGQRQTQYGRYLEQRELQQVGKLAGLQAEMGVAETQYKIDSQRTAMEHTQHMEKEHNYQMLIRDEKGNLLNYDAKTGQLTEDNSAGGGNVAKGGQASKVITNTNDAGVGDIMNANMVGANWEKFVGYQQGQHSKQMAMGEYMWEKQREIADYQKTVIDSEYQMAQAQKEVDINVANKQLDLAVESKEIVLDTAAQVKKTWLQLAQKTEQWLENFDSITNDLGINLGYTNKRQLHDYQTSMFSVVKNVAAKFGKSIEEVAKMQQDFIENTGRNKIMGEEDDYGLLNLSKYLGNDDSIAANYASGMEIFNVGVSDSVDMLGEVLEDVNRIGLNGRKYTKTLVDNLKLAQKYNFKNGTKGLMEMAKWAENTRFNLASLGGMLDKVHEGGLEGVITQGAQFQVLGGHAAMNADPLAMLWESYADPDAYAKRMQDMTKGYGQIDKKTGETKFSVNEMMMMQQLAKIQGRSVEDVENEVRARNKREVVAKQLRGNFDEEQQAFISNNATYNKATGQFQVKVKGADGKYHNKDVNQLSQADLEVIMPEDYQGKMLKGMEDIVSAVETMKGTEIAQKADVAAATYEEMLNQYTERTRIANENYAKHRDEYIEETKLGMEAATAAFKDYIGIFNEGDEDINKSVKQISSTTQNINTALNDTANIIAQANGKIASASGIHYDTPTFTNILDNKDSYKAPWQQVHDGIVRGKNAPIVTKVNDSIVKSDPKDVAIFAKEGGTIGRLVADLDEKLNSSNSGSIKLDTINVSISGSLDLSSGGQSVNIINELQNNPILLRSLSRMLAQQISSAMNGGRGTAQIGINNV